LIALIRPESVPVFQETCLPMWLPALDNRIIAIIAIVISLLSLIISGIALGWNIYRDLILKPRFRVRLGILRWSYSTKRVYGPDLELTVVNFGPGLMVVRAAVIRTQSTFWSWFKNEDSIESVEAENLGAELEKGHKISIEVPNFNECILDKKPLRIGVRDTFGRIRWAPGKDLKKIQREYAKGKCTGSGVG
jgi:hypothetical protein